MKWYSLLAPHSCLAVGCPNDQDFLVPLESSEGWPNRLVDLISMWTSLGVEDRLEKSLANGKRLSVNQCRLDAPIRNCEKLICVGKNYADHAREMGGDVPELPVIFSKFSSAIHPPETDIVLPEISQQVDFEAELVVVIGKSGRNIPQQDAMEFVFGYCCGNDISARDWQKGRPGGQWLLGKTFDTFAPLGPFVLASDQVSDPHGLGIQCRLNGKTMQSSNTQELIFRIDYLIAHISKFVTLKPGDLIFTGTPAGVGAGRDPQVFLKPGDHLEVEIEGLGILANRVNINAS